MNWDLAMQQFMNYLRLERGLSANTLKAYQNDLKQLASWSLESDVRPQQLETEALRTFLRMQATKGKTARSQARMRSSLRTFYAFMLEEEILNKSPMDGIEAPQLGKKLPVYLSIPEVDALLAAVDRSQASGERDVAMIEVLYACGLRVSELVFLKTGDVFREDGLIRVVGKGNKERIVPIYPSALDALFRYIQEVRVHLEPSKGFETHIFLNQRGKAISRVWVFKRLQALAVQAGIQKKIGPHTLRHTFATHLIQHGADIRVIQVLLGHESITTTEMYTHLEQQHLRDAVLKFHPRKSQEKGI
ncbi:MAG: site-specific tyrosine recombinase XerD [Schleiferiaceae bacterium]|nr:site-specific tyrosine recombinase XerD [Schleiferiaceae bacterium]